jgi:hypothetical protein
MIKQVFEERTFAVEFPYSSFPNDFSCDSLTAAILYLNDGESFITLHNFSNTDFLKEDILNTCRLKFNVDELFKENKLYETIKDSVAIQDAEDFAIKVLYDRFRVYVEINGIPEGAIFYRFHQANLEVTETGYHLNTIKHGDCRGG